MGDLDGALQRLAQLEKGATPGPWVTWTAPADDGGDYPSGPRYIGRADNTFVAHGDNTPDSNLIVAMRSALPLLLDVARAAQPFVRLGLAPYGDIDTLRAALRALETLE